MSQSKQAELFARSFQSQVARHPGAACLTLPLLRALGVREAVDAQCASEHTVAHGNIIALLIMNRLQAPRPLYKVQDWLAQSGLEDTLGVQAGQAHDTRLGEALDAVYKPHQTIWQEVVLAAVRRYHLPLDWLHYDMTSTYFEGAYSESELIQFGYSRDHRPDSKQLNLGLTTLRHGLPLAFRVLVGNTADQSTPRQNLEAVRKLVDGCQTSAQTIVHDRGMANAETLVWYECRKQRFISSINADSALQAVLDDVPTAELMAQPLDYQPQRADRVSEPAYYGVWREHTLTHAGHSARLRLLVVHSVSKAHLDAEKRQTLLERLLQRLAKLQAQLNQRKYKRQAYTQEQIHLAQRGNAAAHLVDIDLQGEDGALVLRYEVNATKLAQTEQRDGRYPILTNCWDLTASEVLQHLKEQDQIEKRFWVLKGPLRVHPLWLHKDQRLVSLVLVLMMALLIYCLLEYLVRRAQRQLTGRALLETFAGYTIVLLRFADGSQLWTFPELTTLQVELLTALGLPSPQVSLVLV
jgi:transposase